MAKVVKQEEPQFDWELFGAIIRKSRMKLGYKKADVFCDSIFRRARVNISPVTYYRIETGKQEPTAVQLFGICLALYGEPFPSKIFEACASDEWKVIEGSRHYEDNQLFTPAYYDLPGYWVAENYDKAKEAAEAAGTVVSNKYQAARITEDCSYLFDDTYIPF